MGQIENTDATFNIIIKEADLLYQYEKAAWNARDLAIESRNIRGINPRRISRTM